MSRFLWQARLFRSIQRKVSIDECPECGGHWLDAGELGQIRGLYTDDAERVADFDRFVGQQLGGELSSMEASRERVHRVRSMLSFGIFGRRWGIR